MKTLSIHALERELTTEFERDPRGPRVAQILQSYAEACADWREMALFERGQYTRNLVARTPWFELLLLCWDVGQSSPIHNHAGQNCWMGVLQGEMEELQFLPPGNGRSGALLPGPTKSLPIGKVAFINDEIALHLVRPRGNVTGCSLHCYAKPIETCNVYDEETGTVVSRRLSYHSIRGERVSDGRPAL